MFSVVFARGTMAIYIELIQSRPSTADCWKISANPTPSCRSMAIVFLGDSSSLLKVSRQITNISQIYFLILYLNFNLTNQSIFKTNVYILWALYCLEGATKLFLDGWEGSWKKGNIPLMVKEGECWEKNNDLLVVWKYLLGAAYFISGARREDYSAASCRIIFTKA